MKQRVKVILLCGLITSINWSAAIAAQKKRVTAPPPAAAGERVGPLLLELRSELQPNPRLILRTSGSPAFSSYSPQPDVYVVDLAQTTKGNGVATPTTLPGFVASMAIDQALELGRPLTRVTLRFTEPVMPTTSSDGDSVVISFPMSMARVETAAPAVEPAPPVRIEPEVETVLEQPATAAPVSLEQTTPPPMKVTKSGLPAKKLRAVETAGSATELVVRLVADGDLKYTTFKLSNPLRLVVDLEGVKNLVTPAARVVNDPIVKRIRVSQFKSDPKPVTRVVLDLAELADYRVEKSDDSLLVAFKDESGSGAERIASAPAQPIAPKPLAVAPAPKRTSDVFEEVPVIATSKTTRATERHVVNSANPEPAPQTRSAPVTNSTRTSTPENVFTDSPSGQATQTTLTGGTQGTGRTLTSGEKVYTGEPIDLNLKDADIRDVLRTFAQLTGLNIAIDPQVAGKVTVSFDDVPWDQALEIILKQNQLTYTLQGNVMRVGTIDRLAAEQAQIRKLEEDEQLNVPLQTVIKHLSYAKASNVAGLLQRMASRRGQIDFDARTNQIIITEIPQNLTMMLNLIETVDIPTPQVVIEARVVETTKRFSRDLGISWNFNGALDPALGTGTGLVFPNRVIATGGPFNFSAGNPVLSLSLGNVLGTFDLDLTLTAAENEGLVKIVSAPKVTTQDNQPAEIQSGIQIPIQTRVNQTTTVSFVDATLRLSVTPQITTADTVIMEITVQKTEPLQGFLIVGATNPPLSTRRATTKLMVRDGGTTVIGGIYQSSENTSQDRLPFVSDIPIIGNLFKNRRFATVHDELLIFITPRIVRNT